ncbi:MAG: hypothetical protein ACFWT2_00945 [Thermoanaerobacterium thermosaccharolyticum]|jgi:hypothetical protein
MHKLKKSYQNNIDINISELYNKISDTRKGYITLYLKF